MVPNFQWWCSDDLQREAFNAVIGHIEWRYEFEIYS